MDISIVILNYKSKGFTLNCVRSIKEADFGKLEKEVIVVDNDSGDHVGEILAWQHPEAEFIQNHTNAGMGRGNNVGLKRARGDYLVVMNPDTIAFPDTFVKLHAFMEAHQDVGVVGPRQLNPDRSVQNSCYRWHSLLTPLYRRTKLGRMFFARPSLDNFLMRDFDHQAEREVDWLLGSFLFCRRQALKEIGYFDERYFLYLEDTDLCRSFWGQGWAGGLLPGSGNNP